jgi:hypothetical protein
MKKKLLIKSIIVFTIFLLIGLGLNPVANSYKTIEQKQSNNIVVNPLVSEIDGTNTFSLNEKELELLKNYISNILPTEIKSDTIINEIINRIKNTVDNNPSLLRKNLVISQGWGNTANFFKDTKFLIKRDAFSFWRFTQSSKTGLESITFVSRLKDDLFSSNSVELYKGAQTGFMIRSIGLYFFQKNTFPMLSYTLFIGFASYVYVNAEKEIILGPPLLP